MAGLVPAIHVCKTHSASKTWMPGIADKFTQSAQSRLLWPGMTEKSTSMTTPLASRIALVTGASRGIGYATARALAKAGAHVVAVARTQGGLEELDDEIRKGGGAATLVPLNLTDFDGIARLGAALHERHGKLDILVGNAGVAGPSSPLGHIELKPWSDVMAINVSANFQLIRCMEPLLKRSDAGRAVFVTSGAASKASAYLGPYAASKAALETLVRVWARETAATAVRVNLFDPGPIRTRMRATVFPGEDPLTLDTPDQAAEFIVPMCAPDWTETGKFYDYKTRSLMSFRAPA
jgi:NAD(P)-dependent dehydrogenase (short-subunit alcohol dehydrogenase family)